MKIFNEARLKEELDNVINDSLKRDVFSGVCLSFSTLKDSVRWSRSYSYGTTEKSGSQKRIKQRTYFDLASLTKPLVTTLSIAVLIEDGLIRLEDELSDCCSWQLPEDKKRITISHLLSHSSGLPAHKPYYKKLHEVPEHQKSKKLQKWILQEELCFSPGTDSLYSDLGFILLGFIIEEKAGVSLDVLWEKKVITPLKLQKWLLFSKNKSFDRRLCAVTQNCVWSGKMLCGIVHDDNCRAMGGVGGHAGLFGTAPAVLSLCEHLIEQFKGREEHPSYSSALLRHLLTRVGKSSWAYGFDTPTRGNSSSGRFFSNESRGHLGFTGTSFWIDFERDTAIVLLTNRVHLSDNIEKIKKLRPLVHDIIMKFFL